MDAELLREWQDRGQFFSENFPGAAAAEKWKQIRDRSKREDAKRPQQDDRSDHDSQNDSP
jgi:hypothetical protein